MKNNELMKLETEDQISFVDDSQKLHEEIIKSELTENSNN